MSQILSEIKARNEERKRLRDAATAGPWIWDDNCLTCPNAPNLSYHNSVEEYRAEEEEDPVPGIIIETDSGYYPPRGPDREFIAYARTDKAVEDIDWLIRHLERN